jgi:putative heme transporter
MNCQNLLWYIMQAMGKHPFFRRNWKLIVNLITVAVLVLLVILIRDQIIETFRNLGKVNWHFLVLILPLTAIGYHAQTRMYQRMFELLGHKLHYKFMARVALELNFVNQVFPSGGVSGISYFGVRMRSANITATQASLVQLMKLLLIFVSFEALLALGLLILALDGQANDLMLLVAGSLTTLLLIGTVAFVMIIGSERRIHATFTGLTRFINKLVRVFHLKRDDTISIERAEGIVKDLHVSYKVIESRYKELRAPLLWAMVVNMSAILSIYAVYIAFGSWVNLGAIILAYSVANFAGLVSVLPGGAGIYEALMTGVLVACGVPAALSLPVTVMFRVLSTLIQLPPGYYLYHQTVHRTGKTPLDQPPES